MKIRFIFRSKQHNRYSIENVFDSVSKELEKSQEVEKSYAPKPTVSIKNMLSNIISAFKYDGDVFHITGDIHYVTLGLKKKKTVLTICDLVTLYNRSGLRKWLIEFLWYRLPIAKSKYITVISQKTADELCQRFPQARKKIHVINCPVDKRFKNTPKEFDKENLVLLQIGTNNNKNLERLVHAIEGIPCTLDIVGVLSDKQLNLLEEKKINYKSSYNLSNEEILKKYEQCDIVIFVSTYEGFGMPIIEAQAVGRPVITSNISPMKEVSGNGACLVNPYEIESIQAGLIRLITDESYRKKLIKHGRINVSKYSVEAIAQEYIKVYKKII